MGKDHMGYYRDWIQFQSNKIVEIFLFMEMKYALFNDNRNNQKVLSRCIRCCHIQSILVSLQMGRDTKLAVAVCHTCHTKMLPYRLQELIYTASVITGARLIFSSFHYMFLSCSQIGWLEICQENHKMFSL